MRYFFSEDPQTTPFGSGMPGTPVNSYYANTNSVLKLTTLITNSMVNEAHATVQRNIANGNDSAPHTRLSPSALPRSFPRRPTRRSWSS